MSDPIIRTLLDENESYITQDSRCSNCGLLFEFADLDLLDFQVEESDVQPGTPNGPAVYWATGTITCPNCLAVLPFEASS
jgi:hypothetical protein